MDLGNLINKAKSITLTDEQKAKIKDIVAKAAGNKKLIADGLNKIGIKVSEDQVETYVKMAEKL